MKNQSVVICLIVFIILTLAFGTFTVLGYKKYYKETKPALQSAQGELDSTNKSNDQLEADLKLIADKVGEVVEKGDDAAVKNPRTPYNKTLADLKKELEAKSKEIEALAQERDEAIAAAQAAIDRAVEQKQAFEASSSQQYGEYAQTLKDNQQKYAGVTKSFNEQTQEFDSVRLESRKAIAEVDAKTDAARELANNIADINLDLSKRIDSLTNAEFDEANGFVVTVDQVEHSARVSLGSKDGVYNLLTFNVFPANALEVGGAKAKGKVQVVKILGEHACEVKIIDDQIGDPIQPNDLVYTSLWTPGEHMKYALDYRLVVKRNEKNQDKVSDIDEIVNFIEANGGIVAAYIDDEGIVHGKITPDVFRLVVPHEPLKVVLQREAEAAAANGESEVERARREERAKELLATEEAFLKSAENNGVRQMKLTDFLSRSGFKVTEKLDRDFEAVEYGKALDKQLKTGVGSALSAPVFKGEDKDRVYDDSLPFYTEGAQQEQKAQDAPKFRPRAPKL